MRIIYLTRRSWRKYWFRLELLLELESVGHDIYYVAPLSLEQYYFKFLRGEAKRGNIKYKPYLKLTDENAAFALNQMSDRIKKISDPGTIIISNNILQCKAVKRRSGTNAVVIYDMYDRYSEYGNEHYQKSHEAIEKFDMEESEIIATLDAVLCASKTLYNETQKINANTIWFPNAVPERYITPCLPSEKTKKTIGMLSDRLSRIDWELLQGIATGLSDYTIELVGKNDVTGITFPSNVKAIGYLPHNELMQYFSGWTAGLALYVSDRFNYYCCPMKYFEYSARNLPVITTPVPEAKIFAELYPDVISLAATAEEAVGSVRKIELSKNVNAVSLAKENTWAIRANQLTEILGKLTIDKIT